MVEQDQTAFQAWLVAIPSAISAISIFYTRHSRKKGLEKTNKDITDATENAINLIKLQMKHYEERMDSFEKIQTETRAEVRQTRDTQLTIFQKHTETMNEVHATLRTLMKPEVESLGTVKTVEDPPQPHGKVIWKKDE